MHLLYIDDSYSKPYYCFSAIAIPAESWHKSFVVVKDWRRRLKATKGIYVHKELHATELVSGHGNISDNMITKWERCQIYKDGLKILSSIDGLQIFNICNSDCIEWSFERLLNRINRTMVAWDSHAVLICDEGNEAGYTKLARKMGVFNYIPSKYGIWANGNVAINIPTDRIIEDPIFRESSKSYLVQMADFCAFSILQKERPIPSKTKYGLHQAWRLARNKFVMEASPRDPDGIIR